MRPRVGALLAAGALVLALTSFAFADGVFLETWEIYYDVGETVWFTVRNDYDEPIEMPSYPYWRIVEEDTGLPGAGCSGLPTVHILDPGESEDHSWSQVMCATGEPANPGVYWLEVLYSVDSVPGEFLLARSPFCIGESCENLPTGVEDVFDPSTWGRVKGRYRD